MTCGVGDILHSLLKIVSRAADFTDCIAASCPCVRQCTYALTTYQLVNDTTTNASNPRRRFERLRYVEIKHGRISMLAIAGHLIQQNFRLPGESCLDTGPGICVDVHSWIWYCLGAKISKLKG